uniref:Uncharacterized protein n=1 Tax=Timema shepardi TaxID=629360 RepID=A0A7R9G0U9_TIMSH|nr:unnamed protein product [Timema shepardi]
MEMSCSMYLTQNSVPYMGPCPAACSKLFLASPSSRSNCPVSSWSTANIAPLSTWLRGRVATLAGKHTNSFRRKCTSICVEEDNFGKTTLRAFDQDLNLDLSVIGSQDCCKSCILDHVGTEVGGTSLDKVGKDPLSRVADTVHVVIHVGPDKLQCLCEHTRNQVRSVPILDTCQQTAREELHCSGGRKYHVGLRRTSDHAHQETKKMSNVNDDEHLWIELRDICACIQLNKHFYSEMRNTCKQHGLDEVGGWGWRKRDICVIGGGEWRKPKRRAICRTKTSRLSCTQDLSQADEVLDFSHNKPNCLNPNGKIVETASNRIDSVVQIFEVTVRGVDVDQFCQSTGQTTSHVVIMTSFSTSYDEVYVLRVQEIWLPLSPGEFNLVCFKIMDETVFEESLLSTEKLDRTSPELWPEQIPGVLEFMSTQSTSNGSPQPWTKSLDNDEMNLLHQFGSLTAAELIAEVKKLHDVAYQLGLEEAKEMTRGKYLNILNRKKR